jgi:hypothetical protein
MVMSRGTVGNQLTEKISMQRIRGIFTALSLIGLLAACAPMSANVIEESAASHTAIQNATTLSDHYALAKHFEDAAKAMQAKAEEQKALLEQYEKVHLYGWQSHNLKSRTLALIRKYEQAAQSNMREATSHREMARQLGSNYVSHEATRPFEIHHTQITQVS